VPAAGCWRSQPNSPQIDVSVNAPESGMIKRLLVNEEDTVVVGQDIVALEPGASGKEKKAEEKSNELVISDEPAPSKPKQQEAQQPAIQPEASKTSPTDPKPESSSRDQPRPSKREVPGIRDERRVCDITPFSSLSSGLISALPLSLFSLSR
jgi:2-oxoglutarate dehydrogenase E2 component (dihydrolipoamide succinyltransferase)